MSTLIAIGTTASNWSLEPPLVTHNAEGWDELRELIRHTSGAAGFTLGEVRSPAGIAGTFFLQNIREVACQLGQKVVELTSRGIAADKGYVCEPTAYTEAVTGTVIGLPDVTPGTPARGNIQIPRVGVTCRWLSAGSPDSSIVGTNQTPPQTFGLPTYPFGSIDPASTLYHYPEDWYLAKRDAIPLPQTAYYAVTDYYINQPNPTFSGS